MLTVQPIEATKNKEFYMDSGVVKTRAVINIDKLKEDSNKSLEIPISFSCWECEPDHTHFFSQNLEGRNLLCSTCGKKFHELVDVTDYKEVIK